MGVLSLTEHSLDDIPHQIFHPDLKKKLRTLDLSNNNIEHVTPKLADLSELKSLNLDKNKLTAGTLSAITKLSKLEKLSVAGNRLGHLQTQLKGASSAGPKAPPPASAILPALPTSLKEMNIASNYLISIPTSILSSSLKRLESLDLSGNQLATVEDVWVLPNLVELRLDNNLISSLPEAVGTMKKLKVLSLENNHISVTSTVFNERTNPQPLPKSLFEDTPLIDLNLHGNRMTNTQLNEFEGFQTFLDRRQKVKSKTLMNLSVCGLK